MLNLYFRSLQEFFPHHRPDQYSELISKKTAIYPQHVLPLNEQQYGDVVKILEIYVGDMETIYKDAEVDMPMIQIGGDQLTRERFSSAKSLRLGTKTQSQRFEKLFPISCEFFHMAMKFLTVCFKHLWSEGATHKATLYAQKVRLQRNQVKNSVKDSYNECKDFFVSYVDAVLLESILTHFQMNETNASPPTLCMPEEHTLREQWAIASFSNMIRANVGTFTYEARNKPVEKSAARLSIASKCSILVVSVV